MIHATSSAGWEEVLQPPAREVIPSAGVNDEGPVGGHGGDEAEDGVMDLAAEAARFV